MVLRGGEAPEARGHPSSPVMMTAPLPLPRIMEFVTASHAPAPRHRPPRLPRLPGAQRAIVSAGLRRDEVCITFAGRLFSPVVLVDRDEVDDMMLSLRTWLETTRREVAPIPAASDAHSELQYPTRASELDHRRLRPRLLLCAPIRIGQPRATDVMSRPLPLKADIRAGGRGERRLGAVALPGAAHRDVDQGHRASGHRRQVEQGLDGELALADRQSRGSAKQGRRRLRQPVEAERLQLDLPVQVDDADLREGYGVPRAAPSCGG